MRQFIDIIESNLVSVPVRVWYNTKTRKTIEVSDMYDHGTAIEALALPPDELDDAYDELDDGNEDALMELAFKNHWVRINTDLKKTHVPYMMAGNVADARKALKYLIDIDPTLFRIVIEIGNKVLSIDDFKI